MKLRRVLLFLLPLPLAGATFNVQGTNLTVTSDRLVVSFRGADVVGITNRLTGENYLRAAAPNLQLNMTLVQPPSQPLAASGTWNLDAAKATVTLTFTDANRSV